MTRLSAHACPSTPHAPWVPRPSGNTLHLQKLKLYKPSLLKQTSKIIKIYEKSNFHEKIGGKLRKGQICHASLEPWPCPCSVIGMGGLSAGAPTTHWRGGLERGPRRILLDNISTHRETGPKPRTVIRLWPRPILRLVPLSMNGLPSFQAHLPECGPVYRVFAADSGKMQIHPVCIPQNTQLYFLLHFKTSTEGICSCSVTHAESQRGLANAEEINTHRLVK